VALSLVERQSCIEYIRPASLGHNGTLYKLTASTNTKSSIHGGHKEPWTVFIQTAQVWTALNEYTHLWGGVVWLTGAADALAAAGCGAAWLTDVADALTTAGSCRIVVSSVGTVDCVLATAPFLAALLTYMLPRFLSFLDTVPTVSAQYSCNKLEENYVNIEITWWCRLLMARAVWRSRNSSRIRATDNKCHQHATDYKLACNTAMLYHCIRDYYHAQRPPVLTELLSFQTSY